MSSGFLLVETVPGREGQVLELLARMPGVTHRSVLFPAAIAVKIDLPRDVFEGAAMQLGKLDGVVATRLYRTANN